MSFNPWIHNIYEPVLSLFPEEYEVLRQYALQATREDHLTMAYLNAQTEKSTFFSSSIMDLLLLQVIDTVTNDEPLRSV